jgi:hypothetical protein
MPGRTDQSTVITSVGSRVGLEPSVEKWCRAVEFQEDRQLGNHPTEMRKPVNLVQCEDLRYIHRPNEPTILSKLLARWAERLCLIPPFPRVMGELGAFGLKLFPCNCAKDFATLPETISFPTESKFTGLFPQPKAVRQNRGENGMESKL